jgi:hypothetical protein
MLGGMSGFGRRGIPCLPSTVYYLLYRPVRYSLPFHAIW